jgi:hypothetical protein
MSAAQLQVFEKISELMREHFTAGVVIVGYTVDGATEDDTYEADDYTYHGGHSVMIGLLVKCLDWYLRKRFQKDEGETA